MQQQLHYLLLQLPQYLLLKRFQYFCYIDDFVSYTITCIWLIIDNVPLSCHKSRIACFIKEILYFFVFDFSYYSITFNDSKIKFNLHCFFLISNLFILIDLYHWGHSVFDDASNLVSFLLYNHCLWQFDKFIICFLFVFYWLVKKCFLMNWYINIKNPS